MHEIDFLPIEYRQKHQRRRSQPWQVAAAVAIVGLVAAAALAQHCRWRRAQAELEAIAPAHEAAVNLRNRLAEVQQKLSRAKANAELYAYLRHPWPRTQLLSALVAPLPDEITLQQVRILRETPSASSHVAVQPPTDARTEEERLRSLTPADRDLAKLRGRLDAMQTVVVLTGMAAESAVLHRYLGELDATDIFEKAELDCFNSVDKSKGGSALQFRVVLAVQPGYGQPGGPTGINCSRHTPCAVADGTRSVPATSDVSGKTR